MAGQPLRKLAKAMEAQGIEPCHRCPNVDICATGLACSIFVTWASPAGEIGDIEETKRPKRLRVITDSFFWMQNRRKYPDKWRPTVKDYDKIFTRGNVKIEEHEWANTHLRAG